MILGFVHVPKTGGSTIIKRKNVYPILCNNFEHTKISTLMEHSHNHKYITLIRDPYQQSVSKYYHMTRNNIGGVSFSLEDFLMDKTHRDWSETSYKTYYDSMNVEDFDFVGITNEMEKNRKILKVMFNFEFSIVPQNVNKKKFFGKNYEDNFYKEQFKKDHKDDYEIYFNGINKFNQLCKKYL